jgi:hypothetical protein
MSELREQFERGKEIHHAARYPGDLAADVLPALRVHPLRRRIFWIGGGVGSAIAAAIALMILLHRPHTATTPPASVFVRHTPPAMPEMPSDLPIVPPYQSLTSIPAMPEVTFRPSMSAKPVFPSHRIDL